MKTWRKGVHHERESSKISNSACKSPQQLIMHLLHASAFRFHRHLRLRATTIGTMTQIRAFLDHHATNHLRLRFADELLRRAF